MKLAIITCKDLPLGVKEDAPLFEALKLQNISFHIHPWDAQVDWSEYDVCLLRSVWDYHQRIHEFNAWLQATSNLTQIINNPKVVMWNQSKKYLAELQRSGINIAPTQWLNLNQAVDLEPMMNPDTPTYFLKPVVGADSSDTLRFDNNSAGLELARIHLEKLLPKQEMMLQPYLNTVETFGETSAIYLSGKLSHAVRKIPVTGDYRVQDTFGASDVRHDLSLMEKSLSESCLQFLTDKFGEISYARFDFLQGEDDHVYLNEAELIEPSLFFHHDKRAALKMTQAIQKNWIGK